MENSPQTLDGWSLLLEASLSIPTVLFSTVLVLSLVYWLLVIVGAVGLEGPDIEAEIDLDVDVGDPSAAAESLGAFQSVLHFMGIGKSR